MTANIDVNDFPEGGTERCAILSALGNIPSMIRDVNAALRRAQSCTISPIEQIIPTRQERDCLRLLQIFHVNATNPTAGNDISTIISRYQAAGRFLDAKH